MLSAEFREHLPTDPLLDEVRISLVSPVHDDNRRSILEFHDSDQIKLGNARIITVK